MINKNSTPDKKEEFKESERSTTTTTSTGYLVNKSSAPIPKDVTNMLADTKIDSGSKPKQ